MPSKINVVIQSITTSVNILKEKTNTFIATIEKLQVDYNFLKSQLTSIKSTAEKALKGNNPYGLTDLIKNKLPTFSGWDVDPNDAIDITDNNISTICTTGSTICAGGFQYSYIEYDLGNFYNVLYSFVGYCSVTAGSGYVYINFWDGSNWIVALSTVSSPVIRPGIVHSARCSKIRISLAASVAATVSPHIREFNVWRLN